LNQSKADLKRPRRVRLSEFWYNNHLKISALEQAGIAVTEPIPLWTGANPHNAGYVATMLKRMGHIAPVLAINSTRVEFGLRR
jgi:GTP cyclohydrolase II